MDTLKDIRIKKGFTLEEMAEQLGVAKSTYYYYESGVKTMSEETKLKISELLGIKTDDIFLPVRFTVSKQT